jgi:hypothetical protein
LSVLIIFGCPITENTYNKWLMASLVASPTWAEAQIKPLKVSTVACTNLNFPKDGTCVTSICHNSPGISLLGLTPRWGSGRSVRQFLHCFTFCLAYSLVILYLSLNLWALRWWRAWAVCASERGSEREARLVSWVAWAAKSFPSVNGPGRLECARIWPTKKGRARALISIWILKNIWKVAVEGWILGTTSKTWRALTT